METLCLVVGVYFLESLVEYVGKLADAFRLLSKLYEPLVAAFGVLVHKHRGGSIFLDLGPRFGAGVGKSLLGVILYKLLAEGIDEVFCASGDDKLVGLARGELHGVANHVSP